MTNWAVGAYPTVKDSVQYNQSLIDSTAYQNYTIPQDSISNISFSGNSSNDILPPVTKENSGWNSALLILGAGAVGLGVACFAKGKGTTGFLKRMKAGWNEIMPKWLQIGKAASSATRNVGNLVNGAQEYTVIRDGVTIVMRGGKPVRITTSARETLTDPNKIRNYLNLSENASLQTTINELNIQKGQSLPDTVKLIYEKTFGKHTYVVENGKIVKVIGKGNNGLHTIEGENLTKFLEKHAADAQKATTLTRTISGKEISGIAAAGDSITVTASNGKILSAKVNGKELSKEELEKLYSVYKKEIKAFGRDAGSTYKELTSYNYQYRNSGNVYTINADGKTITGIEHNVAGTPITGTQEIEKFMNKHTALKNELDGIASNGVLPEGFRFGDIIIKTEDGLTCTIGGNGHTLEKIVLNNGTTINKDQIAAWRETAENENLIAKVLEMIK